MDWNAGTGLPKRHDLGMPDRRLSVSEINAWITSMANDAWPVGRWLVLLYIAFLVERMRSDIAQMRFIAVKKHNRDFGLDD